MTCKNSVDSAQIQHPFFGMVEIISSCNSRCAYCYCWKTSQNSSELTPEVCELLFPEMVSLGVRKLIITGGEPLLHQHLEEIVKIAYSNRLHTSIVTNGLYLKYKCLNSLKKAGLLGLTLSLDTLDPITYQQLRGVSFDLVKNAVSLISDLAEEKSLSISVNCVLTALNYPHLVELVNFFTDQGVPVMIQPCNTDAQTEMAYLLPDKENISGVRVTIDTLIKMKQQGALILNSASFLQNIIDYWNRNIDKQTFRCYYSYVNVTVKHNGDVIPCWRLPVVDNIHSKSLTKIWESDEFYRRRQQMISGNCPGCWLSCSFDWKTLWHQEEQVNTFWQNEGGI